MFRAYVHDADLCIYQVITAYLQHTRDRQTAHSLLLISFQKPHLPIGRYTLARWIRTVMARSCINTTFYKPHTTQSTSVSAASQANLPLTQILKMAGGLLQVLCPNFTINQLFKQRNLQIVCLIRYELMDAYELVLSLLHIQVITHSAGVD